MTIRVRFAPSPTGFLHVGGARTALYNWLFARRENGVFLLRIEDTDEARSTDASMAAILAGLRWLGLDWDEGPGAHGRAGTIGECGPYFQAERLPIYREHLERLVSAERAYPCFCSKEELEQMRHRAMLLKRPPKYDGRCRKLSAGERAEKLSQGVPHVFRFARPMEGAVQFEDLVKGTVRFESELLDDFVLLKSSGFPTFMFAGAIDDHVMGITHVIRGDDHLSNTPRQLQLYEAFGWETVPVHAHISMIHGPDGSRLSKRHGATAIEEFQKDGYLPEAMLNYLALLGWSTSDSQQLFDPTDGFRELVEKFDLARCQKSAAIFDTEKLRWMNGVLIRGLSPEALIARAWPYLVSAGLVEEQAGADVRRYAEAALALEQEKLVVLFDVPGLVDFFFRDEVVFDPESVRKVFGKDTALVAVSGVRDMFGTLASLTAQNTEEACRRFAAEKSFKTGEVFHPVRVAVSGRTKGPSLFHMLAVLGKERVLARMDRVLAKPPGGA